MLGVYGSVPFSKFELKLYKTDDPIMSNFFNQPEDGFIPEDFNASEEIEMGRDLNNIIKDITNFIWSFLRLYELWL